MLFTYLTISCKYFKKAIKILINFNEEEKIKFKEGLIS